MPADRDTNVRGGQGTVLLVEDNDAIRKLVAGVLKSAGFDVRQAQDGVEALAQCDEGLTLDLLLTDVVMPKMGGVELAKRLHQLIPGVKVLYISGHPFETLNLPELDPEREIYLAKPFSLVTLRKEVRRALSLGTGSDGSESGTGSKCPVGRATTEGT
jgi:CheY-like chemotaxis protein